MVERYRLDRNRVYLSGLSRGAYSAWRLVVQYTDRFAALIAISGEALMNYARLDWGTYPFGYSMEIKTGRLMLVHQNGW
ncbi:MAG: hypothetical protein CBC31_010270 [Verrucomicrobia bacterium TMED71]|nr:MAG: hypothetical protein CBC31_010270 [Verrucomicrobia bacterium TMED71]